ncbi:hypothetical protein vseg_001127 [Gypsophila vaccaria]
MSNKMKGLLKGLRYISQIFEEEEEPEMQIGCPTDVKHVAHIGWDGPTASSPSWIQQFKDGEAPPNGDQQIVPATRDPRLPDQEKRVSTRSENSTLEPSPSRRRSDKPKGAKRHSSAGSSNPDSPKRTSSSSASETTTTSSSKTSRRRKPKTSSKSKATSTTPDTAYSDPGVGLTTPARKSKDTCQSSVLTNPEVDQNALDDKAARRIRAM